MTKLRESTVHVAYSAATRNGLTSYWAKAAVTDGDLPGHHTVRSGIGDSAAEAVDCALSYVFETYQSEGLEPPKHTIIYGRVPRTDIERVGFLKRH